MPTQQTGRLASRVAVWGLAAFLVYALLTRTGGGSLLAVGAAPPAMSVDVYEGGHFDLGQARGHVAVINFWATWCPPCRAEAPVLARAHAELARAGGTVIGVSMDSSGLPEVGPAARRLGMTYPIALGTPALRHDFRVEELPTTYVIGRSGTIVAALVGGVSDEWLTNAIAEARDK